MTTTTYRCAACGKDVEVEVIDIPTAVNVAQVIEVAPCEVCIGVAVEAEKEESYDNGWQAGYDTMSEEEEEPSNSLFTVTREGVYRHEILGVFDKAESARKVARAAFEKEADDYHGFDVYKFIVNKELEDGELVYRISEREERGL